jgi:hypothetical protein
MGEEYVWDHWVKVRKGFWRGSWWRLPMRGRGVGPGGKDCWEDGRRERMRRAVVR